MSVDGDRFWENEKRRVETDLLAVTLPSKIEVEDRQAEELSIGPNVDRQRDPRNLLLRLILSELKQSRRCILHSFDWQVLNDKVSILIVGLCMNRVKVKLEDLLFAL